MVVLGLTGSIAMGKSTAALMFRRLGVPVFDADHCVHRLLARGGRAVSRIEALFPGTVVAGAVDRPALAAKVFGDDKALARLEAILHPLVAGERRRFLGRQRRRGAPLVVIDVPLLFETGHDRGCDWVAVVSAPAFLQRQRLRRRPGMTPSRLRAIAARQLPDHAKRRRADVVLPSGLGRAVTFARVKRLVATLRAGGPPSRRPASQRAR